VCSQRQTPLLKVNNRRPAQRNNLLSPVVEVKVKPSHQGLRKKSHNANGEAGVTKIETVTRVIDESERHPLEVAQKARTIPCVWSVIGRSIVVISVSSVRTLCVREGSVSQHISLIVGGSHAIKIIVEGWLSGHAQLVARVSVRSHTFRDTGANHRPRP